MLFIWKKYIVQFYNYLIVYISNFFNNSESYARPIGLICSMRFCILEEKKENSFLHTRFVE